MSILFGASGEIALTGIAMVAAGLYGRYRIVQAFHVDGQHRSVAMYLCDLVAFIGGLGLLGSIVAK